MISNRLPGPIATELAAGLKSKVAVQAAAAWVEAKAPRLLVLEGDPGAGKSLAAAWAFEFVYERIRHSGPYIGDLRAYRDEWPVWCDARLVCGLVGVEWRHEDRWRAFDDAKLVVIDDVGTEDKPERMTSLLERLHNVSSGRAILTTNLSFEAFSERYGDRIQSRIIGAAQWVQIADPDMRMLVPEGTPFARPKDETASELVARLKAEEERKREEAEWEAGKAERERWWAEHMADLARLTGEKHLRVAPTGESDDEARERLRRQVEQLQRDRGEAG